MCLRQLTILSKELIIRFYNKAGNYRLRLLENRTLFWDLFKRFKRSSNCPYFSFLLKSTLILNIDCVCTQMHWHTCPRTTCSKFPSAVWVSRTKLRSLGLVASILTCWRLWLCRWNLLISQYCPCWSRTQNPPTLASWATEITAISGLGRTFICIKNFNMAGRCAIDL